MLPTLLRRDYMETIRVIIIDEQPLFRAGIHATLERMGDCEIVGESTDAADVLEIARTCNPDVALIDAGLTSSDPLEIARQVRHITPRLAVIILTPSEDEERLFQAIKVGAAAYCSRHITTEELIDTVRKVSHGEYLIRDDVLSKPRARQSCPEIFPRTNHRGRGDQQYKGHVFPTLDPRSRNLGLYCSRQQ